MINDEHIEQVLGEIESLRDPCADPELEAVKAAILLEDVFGIRLTDVHITPELLNHPTAVVRLVSQQQNSI